jgi:ribonuclease HI
VYEVWALGVCDKDTSKAVVGVLAYKNGEFMAERITKRKLARKTEVEASRVELLALISALSGLKGHEATIYTQLTYVAQCWDNCLEWKRNRKENLANMDLLKILVGLKNNKTSVKWVDIEETRQLANLRYTCKDALKKFKLGRS